MTRIELILDGVATGVLDPWEAVGTEAISALYSFDVACDLLGSLPDEGIVGKAATLTITPGGGTPRVVHGVVDGFRIASSIVYSRPPIVHVRLVPRLSLLRLFRQNHIFGTTRPVTVAELIDGQMRGTLRRGNSALGHEPTFAADIRLKQSYPSRDHVAQYDETNLDFLAR